MILERAVARVFCWALGYETWPKCDRCGQEWGPPALRERYKP